MRSIPAPLQAHLDTGATTLCRCWRLTRQDGMVMGFTDHDGPLAFDGLAYEPGSGLDAGALESASGLGVDNVEALGALSATAITEDDLERGLYDGSEIDLFLVNWNDPALRVLLFRGALGETRRGPLTFRTELRGMAHALEQPVGRAYLLQCDAELGDARCGLDLAPLTVSGTVESVSESGELHVSGLGAFDHGWFSRGLITWTSGANMGARAPVREHVGGRLALWTPPPDSPAPGDAFTLTPGCDKRFGTCRAKFTNSLNFRGFPYIPGDGRIASYPNREDNNNGGALL